MESKAGTKPPHQVVIVGGGINGLTAANYLQKQNFDVKILEKNDNIGGACVKDSVIINKKPVDYPKGATVLGMMQKFIFEETNLSKFITPKLFISVHAKAVK